MKNSPRIILYLFFTLTFQSLIAQQETCSNKETEIEDLNSISKCTVEEVKNKENKKTSVLKVAYRKVRKRSNDFVLKKRGKINTIETKNTIDKSFVSSTTNDVSLNLTGSQVILFSVIDNIPLFPKCSSKNKNQNLTCFNKQMAKHFSKNFYPERIEDDKTNERVFIQFIIDKKGNVKNIEVKAKEKSMSLEKEIKRVINKLPKFSPGIHQSLPVNVKYSIPITLTQS